MKDKAELIDALNSEVVKFNEREGKQLIRLQFDDAEVSLHFDGEPTLKAHLSAVLGFIQGLNDIAEQADRFKAENAVIDEREELAKMRRRWDQDGDF